MTTIACLECDQETNEHARGLCKAGCYSRHYYAGDIDQYPRKRDLLLDEWVILRARGYSYSQAAPRLGVDPRTLDRALCRAKRRGDDRGCRSPHDLARWQASHREAA